MCTYLNFTSRFVCWLVCSHLSRFTVFNSLFETGLTLGFVCLFVCLFTISQVLQVYKLTRLQVYQSTVCTCWTIKNPLKLASLFKTCLTCLFTSSHIPRFQFTLEIFETCFTCLWFTLWNLSHFWVLFSVSVIFRMVELSESSFLDWTSLEP